MVWVGEFIAVAKEGEVQPGKGKAVSAKGRPIALFNVEGNLCAIDNTCKHAGGPLGEGALNGCVVTCPMHGWKYDVKTGQCLTVPAFRQQRYTVKVEGGDVLVEV